MTIPAHTIERPINIGGVYAITPNWDDTAVLLAAVRAALEGGIRLLQYRHKTASAFLRTTQAQALQLLCAEYSIPLIINDDIALAKQLDADGVHLGRDDGDLALARTWSAKKIIGVSCYGDLLRAQAAAQAGASYVAFGACFPSASKPQAPLVSADTVRTACATLAIPVVAIGGIQASNAPVLRAQGVAAIAVIDELFHHTDPSQIYQKTQTLVRAFDG